MAMAPDAAVAANDAVASKLDMGAVKRAMALRVKYRLVNEAGHFKRRLNLKILGVHPENRAGVYPQGDVVMGLGMRLAQAGFSQEEADHRGVCVQQPPDGDYGEYNKSKCRGQPALEKCFGVDADVLYGTLSHNHLLLVCLSWLNCARWELSEKDLQFVTVDQSGRLDLGAAVAVNNLKELVKSCQEGFLMEVLSWKIMKEEPGACSLISSALNMGNEVALRTTELTALSVLSGQCALQWQRSASDEISYDAVAAAVRSQLDGIVDEAEFKDLFEFVINLGAEKNPFVPDLIDFGARFVDQKQRQLRLSAFADINKVDPHFPRVKVAALKRAYRKKPQHGFCPSPESKFRTASFEALTTLEQLLHYFHYGRRAAVAALGDEHRQKALLANVDVAAADAFMGAQEKDLKTKLLEATHKYEEQLKQAAPAEMQQSVQDPRLQWIVFTAPSPSPSRNSAVAELKLNPKIIQFDPNTGEARSSQDTVDPNIEAEILSIPWRTWATSEMRQTCGEQEAAMRCALQVLHAVHARYAYEDLPLDIQVESGKLVVRAQESIPMGKITLPPCVPKAKTLAAKSLHPYRVEIEVRVNLGTQSAVAEPLTDESENGEGPDRKRQKKKATVAAVAKPPTRNKQFMFYAIPEWKAPAVAETSAAVSSSTGCTREWQWTGEETMHPFWAIRRVPESKARGECTINMESKQVALTTVVVGAVNGVAMTATAEVSVPVLTNRSDIARGAELVMQVDGVEKVPRKPKTWKDTLKQEDKIAKKTAKSKSAAGGASATDI